MLWFLFFNWKTIRNIILQKTLSKYIKSNIVEAGIILYQTATWPKMMPSHITKKPHTYTFYSHFQWKKPKKLPFFVCHDYISYRLCQFRISLYMTILFKTLRIDSRSAQTFDFDIHTDQDRVSWAASECFRTCSVYKQNDYTPSCKPI